MAKPELAALIDLIRQQYALDPGSLEFLVEESLPLAGGPVQAVCSLLASGGLTSIERENVESFIRRAATNVNVERDFRRAVKPPFGRCPKPERAWLKRVLTPTPQSGKSYVSRTTPEPVRPRLIPSTAEPSTERLDLRDLSGSIGESPLLLDRLGQLSAITDQLELALHEFTYSSALAIIAQWILARGLRDKYRFVETPLLMRNFLNEIRFKDALLNEEIIVSPNPMDWAVGLTRINRALSTEKVTDKIVDILTTFINPNVDDRSALSVLIAEMIENVHRHAAAPVDGFAVAQVYPSQLKMGITLVDAGIGVRRSFEEGDPSVPISDLRSDEDFLCAAIKLYATSKSIGHSGYGLYLLSELISRNRGTFLLASGSATLIGYRRAGKLFLETSTHRPWQGTIVSVIINLKRDLPLSQIYREMPIAEGTADEDLFQA